MRLGQRQPLDLPGKIRPGRRPLAGCALIAFQTLLVACHQAAPFGIQCSSQRFASVMTLTAVLTPDQDGGYVAQNPETGTTTQGDTVDEALANLKEATALYLEEFPFKVVATS